MRDWIVIAILYVLVLVLFRVVGGVTAAGDAVRRWGLHASRRGMKASSSS
jgi:uncharacterized protein HemY